MNSNFINKYLKNSLDPNLLRLLVKLQFKNYAFFEFSNKNTLFVRILPKT